MSANPSDVSSWPLIVHQIQEDDTVGFRQLYDQLGSIKGYLCKQVGPDRADDAYHDTIVELVQQIRKGLLRDPNCLFGYAQVIAARKSFPIIRELMQARRTSRCNDDLSVFAASPERQLVEREQREIGKRILAAMPERDREVLIRFYINGETPEAIQTALHLSENQFRLIKSRAKARFADLCAARMALKKRPSNPASTILTQPLKITASPSSCRVVAAGKRCGTCEWCTHNAKWERIYQNKFADPDCYSGTASWPFNRH